VAEHPPESANRPDATPVGGRLDSWKEIAAYLQRDVTTVRRWEKRERLPVHRHVHDKLGTVYAFKSEIDEWWLGRGHQVRASDEDRRADEDVSPPVSLTDNGQTCGRERLAWVLAATFFAIAVISTVALVTTYVRTAVDQAEYRFSIPPPERGAFGTVAVSPDGRHLAFTAYGADGIVRLWVRRLDSVEARPLAATEDAAFPFWSPDSRFIGFFAGGKLKKVEASGGAPQTVCDAVDGRGGSWNQDDVILFAPGREGALHRVAAVGGLAPAVTTVERPRHRGHLWPAFLPDGRHFLYLADSANGEHHVVYIGALDTNDAKPLLQARSNAVYTPEGFLLFARDGALVAQRFDLKKLALTDELTVITDRVAQLYGLDHKGDFSTSNTGVLVFRGGGSPLKQLTWIDRRGQRLGYIGEPADYAEPVLSPDGTRVAVSVFDPSSKDWASDIWLLDVPTGAPTRLTFDRAADFEPVWSPDGEYVAFASKRGGTLNLYRKRVSGSGPDELLLTSDTDKHSEAWSPDGRFLTYSSLESNTKYDVWLLPLEGEQKPQPFLHSQFSEGQSQISPNGRWIAYTSFESDRMEVYVRPFPAGAGQWQVSSAGGGDPRWRRDGRELFYIAADGTLMSMAVESDRVFTPGIPQPLFDTKINHLWDDARNHYDVSLDGQRFLVATPIDNLGSLPLTMVVNWKNERP
jgi:Tol biopolymer transport system component